jgi:hypothetical protein
LKRLIFVFYYNLIRLYKDNIATVELANWFWEQQEFEKWEKEAKKNSVNAFKKRNNAVFDITRTIMKASKEVTVLIQEDRELQDILKKGMKEINSKFAKPKIINELLSEITPKSR